MDALPFSLRVPGKDVVELSHASSTQFKFHGFLRVGDGELLFEWSGTAKVEEVGLLGVDTRTLSLPYESLALSLDRIGAIALRGGWWRPYLEVTGNDLKALRIIPGEGQGRVRLWLTRSHRELAAAVIAAVESGKRGALRPRSTLQPARTPPDGVDPA